MAWYPRARRREIPPGSNDPRIIPVGVVLHVDAGNAASLYDYFDGRSGGIESHFHVQRDGDVEQYRDTGYEADANYKGNSWPAGKSRHGLLSVETQGFEHGEWTRAQLDAIKDLLRWAAGEHGFPLQVAPTWQGPGVGYHVMFGAPGPWTPIAKTCPGPDRVQQFKQIIVPWLESEASGGAVSLYDEFKPQSSFEKDLIPSGWADEGYRYLIKAAAALAWLRSQLYDEVWYGDRIAAPDSYPHADTNPNWQPRRFLQETVESLLYHVQPDAARTRELVEAMADSQLGTDAAEIKAHIDQRHAEAAQQRQELADRLDEARTERQQLAARLAAAEQRDEAMLDLLQRHADGSLDEAAVVDGIRDLLHQATAPDDE
ncbi:MAG: N-acetylmuramoyl-L-alanine amidase [Actinomycetota bacterium]